MKTGFLITARLKSTRLPKKALLPLNGYTVIERIIQRAKQIVESQDIVLCTSFLNQDLSLIKIAADNGIFYFNGHPEDVLKRLLDASELFGFDFFLGITADNPLFSVYHGKLISELISKNNNYDYIFTSEMPVGVNIYGINVKALKTVCKVKEIIDTEIWGYLINRPEIFNIKKLCVKKKFLRKDYRLTLDEPKDYEVLKKIFDKFQTEKVIDVLDAYKFLDMYPQIAELNKNVKQRDLEAQTIVKIDDFYKKNHELIKKIKRKIYSS